MRLTPACLITLALATAPAGDTALAGRQRNLESFDKVWSTIRDRHWDRSYNGVDWERVRGEFRPKVEKAKTPGDARTAMQAMLARLRQTHFGIIPAEAYEDMDRGNDGRDGTPGIDTRLIDNRVIVTSVEPGSPADKAGLRPGWELLAIDGKELAASVGRLRRSWRRDLMQPALVVRQMVKGRLDGRRGMAVKVRAADDGGQARSFELDRVPPRGVLARFGHLPPIHVWAEWRKLSPKAGYIAFNLFFDPENVMKVVGDAVSSCESCDGLIIDLRGNPGGIGGMAMGMAGFFVDTPGRKLGTMLMRDNKLLFAVSPRPRTFAGRLAILVDGCSASTSEIFAEGMKDLGRARIFGTRTAGAALPSMFERLPNGDGFQYAFANYISEAGKRLEGSGVEPDVVAPPTRKALLAGRDAALEAALAWISLNPRKG